MIKSDAVRRMCAAIARDVAAEYDGAFMGAKSFSIASKAAFAIDNLSLDCTWQNQLKKTISYLQIDRVPDGGNFAEAFSATAVNLPLEEIENRIRHYYARYTGWEKDASN